MPGCLHKSSSFLLLGLTLDIPSVLFCRGISLVELGIMVPMRGKGFLSHIRTGCLGRT
jgi:hypothetical protein